MMANLVQANIENQDPKPQDHGQLFIFSTDPTAPNTQDRVDYQYDVQATYTIQDPSAKLYLTRTWQTRMPDGSLSAPQSDNPVALQSIPQKDGGSATQDELSANQTSIRIVAQMWEQACIEASVRH